MIVMYDSIIYDIHGFLISVEGPANKIFLEEYGWAKVNKELKCIDVDLEVKVYLGNSNLPTKPPGSFKGMLLPFREGEKTLWYEKGCPLLNLLRFCEAFMYWPDKALLHAGSVAKNGKAYVFTGGGNVGKTSIVLNLLRDGYEYLSDDWLLVGDGKAYSIPKPIHIFDYNLKSRDIARSALGLKRLYYTPLFKMLELGRKLAPHRYLRFAFETVKPMFRIDLRRINSRAKIADSADIVKVFYLERSDLNYVEVRDDMNAEELARRMAYVNMYEWFFFFREYYRYVYLYDVRNSRVEGRLEHDFNIFHNVFRKTKLKRVILPTSFNPVNVKVNSILDLE